MALKAGLALCKLEQLRVGETGCSGLLKELMFGAYNKKFKPNRTANDWICSNAAVVDAYTADELCGFDATVGLTRDMLTGISMNQRKENLEKMDKALPVLFVSGMQDPVGAMGEGVLRCIDAFKRAGLKNVTIRLYPEGRHEMLNETNRTDMMPLRNFYGIIGPIPPQALQAEAIKKTISENSLITKDIDSTPVHAIVTNSTYDGLCYNARRVEELLGQSVDRMHFDEAWYGYARFNPIYKDRFAMYGNPADHKPTDMTVFATQSTHKLLAALSQASFIHIREGKKNVDHSRFNESFMMQASTSPNYPIIASNDITAAMMDGKGGKALTDESIHEAVAFRQLMAKLNADFADQGEWFFNCWQPDFVKDAEGKKIAFRLANPEYLATEPECWVLHPNDAWHGFGDIEDGYCMLDPIKVSITTPGIGPDGLGKMGVPASILSAYLTANGIIPEKTTDFTVLMLFSIGITKGKWGTLIDTLIKFKEDYDNNTALEEVLPDVVKAAPQRYAGMGLRDLCEEMFAAMKELKTTEFMSEGFAVLPHPDMSPAAAYEQLVLDNVEKVDLDGVAERTLATGIVPYPPGIPLIMPGENAGPADGPALGYLKALEGFDRQFPAFEHDSHGVEVENGKYYVTVLKK